MSDERANITGSAAREHEATGGNVKAGQSHLPQAGSAAQAAETDKAPQEATSMRATSGMRLSLVRGARMVEAEAPTPDFSQRTAADYLPAHLKAQLIAAGKLTATGELVTTPAPPAPAPTPAAEIANGAEAAEPGHWLGSLARRLRNLFS